MAGWSVFMMVVYAILMKFSGIFVWMAVGIKSFFAYRYLDHVERLEGKKARDAVYKTLFIHRKNQRPEFR